MNKEFYKKQNNKKMLELQYFARHCYNKAESYFILSIFFITINVLLGSLQDNFEKIAILRAILNILWLLIEIRASNFIKKGAVARELFDAELFEFKRPENAELIYKNAHEISVLGGENAKKQMSNTGKDNPPGVKNWYDKYNVKDKNELIFKCQKENIYWDEKIMLIDKMAWLILLAIISFFYLFTKRNETLIHFLISLTSIIEILIKICGIVCNYVKYENNMKLEKYNIIKMEKANTITENELNELQELIKIRRNLNLIPFNSIHRLFSKKLHILLKQE